MGGKPREGGNEGKPVARWPQGLTLSPWGRVLQTKAHQYQITSCCLSPDRRLLATVCLGGCLKVMPGLCGSQSCPKCCISLGGCSVIWQGLLTAWPGEAFPAEGGDWTGWSLELWD